MFSVDLTIKLLFLQISDNLDVFIQSRSRFKLLDMILKRLRYDSAKRAALQSWSLVFEKMKNFDENMLIGKISFKIIEIKGVVLDGPSWTR